MVTGAAFADSPEEAKAMLKPLEDCPLLPECLSSSFATPLVFEQMFDASGALWPEGLAQSRGGHFFKHLAGRPREGGGRSHGEMPVSDHRHFFAIFTGPNVPAVHPDAAYSMSSRVYGGPWTMWKDDDDDAANSQWHDECTALLRPFNIGYYVGESDTVHRPSNAVQSLSPENWKRLADLRDKYDPDGVFFGYFDGLLDPKAVIIQRFPFRIFAAALIAAGGGRRADGAEVVAPASGPDAPKSVHWKGTLLVCALTRYWLQSLGNSCDMNEHATNSSVPFLRENTKPPHSPLEQPTNTTEKYKDMSTTDIESNEYKKQFAHEATRLAIESVEKGWGGPFGAVIVRDGKSSAAARTGSF